ncbi:hypothetical protein HZA98_02655 [Candidatus Woesearchaeota archaeon]|nr:hypothetical protein [Candidatus Woesearchaeota archaeon]
MALAFLSGAAFTYILIFLIIVALFILWKLIFSPLFRLLGWGAKKAGALASETSSLLGSSMNRTQDEKDRLGAEQRDIAESKEDENKTAELNSTADKLLTEAANTQDFSSEKKTQFHTMLNAQVLLLNRLAERARVLLGNMKKDAVAEGQTVKSMKDIIQNQENLQRQSLQRVELIGKYGQKDPYAETAINIAEKIKPFTEEVMAFDGLAERDLFVMQEIAKRQLAFARNSKELLELSLQRLNKEPLLREISQLKIENRSIRENITALQGLGRQAEQLLNQRAQRGDAILNLEARMRPLIEEQAQAVRASEALLYDLKKRGAVPRKAA